MNPADIKPNTSAVRALYTEMLDKARQRPETLYGSSPAQIARGKIQTLAVADEFPSVMQDLIAVGVKTHFIYYVVAKNNAYKQPLPDVLEDRPGQMDAFGIASGLVAIHTRRPDNSFMRVRATRQSEEPALHRLLEGERSAGRYAGHDRAGHRSKGGRRSHLQEHLGVGAAGAGADRRQERQLGDRALPRQLGRQPGRLVAHARVRRVGDRRSAHGQRAHSRAAQPVHRQPAAAAVSVRERRSRARARRQGDLQGERAPAATRPKNQTIYPASKLGVDAESHDGEHQRVALRPGGARDGGVQHLRPESHRASRAPIGACRKGDWQARLDEYFRDTPRRVAEGTNGYKADMLHGIWAQAPYLHNGSVPTLGQLRVPGDAAASDSFAATCTTTRTLVGFEWATRPAARYSPNETILVKEYDTTVPSKANTGHTFGVELCPDTSGLDPVKNREEIETRILQSRVGALLEYLKTL